MRRKIHAGFFVAVLAAACGTAERADAPREGTGRAGFPSTRTPSLAESIAGDSRRSVLVVGTSLTAGLGVTPEEAYPALLQARIDSVGLEFQVVPAGVSGETSAGGLRRIDWLLQQPLAVLILELGANDGLRGLPAEHIEANLQTIVDRTRAAHPEAVIVIAGMRAPANLGRRYTEAFSSVFADLAARNGSTLIPFLLAGVAAHEELNQSDGIHPTAEGHRIIAGTVWRFLAPILDSLAAAEGEHR